MKVINLIEDTAGADGFLYEHGLSFYIETEMHKILVDTGATGSFINNAKKHGINLELVDTVIISHGHYDHTGGLLEFVKINQYAKIYIQNSSNGEFYSLKDETQKYIGMDSHISSVPTVVLLDGDYRIDNELSIFTGAFGRRLWPLGNMVLKKKVGGNFYQDDFCHEQYIVIDTENMQLLVSGCAHNGILNILDTYRKKYGGAPTHVISGFHTVRPNYTDDDIEIITQMASELSEMDIQFFSGHCTGEYPMKIMKSIMGERLTVLHSGDVII